MRQIKSSQTVPPQAESCTQLHFGERVRPSHSTERVLLNEHGPFAHLHGPFAHLIKERMENPVIGMHQKPQAESCTEAVSKLWDNRAERHTHVEPP